MKKKILINIVALIVGGAGTLGMLYCLPFLYSAELGDLIGAGFPFVGGAILVGTSLISISINNR
ncbi:hypothetical protein [Wenyingzhuangia sp. IMCC45574]